MQWLRYVSVTVAVFGYFQLIHFVASLSENEECVTPNGETATCISITSCPVILHSLYTLTNESREFAKASQCGYNATPLVCCGTTANFLNNNNNDPPSSEFLPNKEICGYSVVDRIYGGEVTRLDEFPWAALLSYKDPTDNSSLGFKCGATLISNRYVLTAAHCLKVPSIIPDFVRLGEWRISTQVDCNQNTHAALNKVCAPPPIDLGIESMMIHPNYSRRSANDDIALIRLNETVEFSEYVHPICLAPAAGPNLKIGEYLSLTGWGSTENVSSSDIKLKVKVPVVSLDDCTKKFSRAGVAVLDTHICAGGELGKDSCQGDSGGALMKHVFDSVNGNGRWFLYGITSTGAGCGLRGIPAIYTKIPKYVDWIINNLQK